MIRRWRRAARPEWLAAGATALALSGCAVGPDFLSPELPAKADYTTSSSVQRTDGAPVALGANQRFVPGANIPHDWWRLFHSRALNSVIADAIAANPSLEAAEANLRSAIAGVRAQEGSLYPSVTTDFSPSRNQTAVGSLQAATSSGAALYNLFTAQANISYTLDVFGGIKRSIEAQGAQADFQFYQLQGTYLTLVSSVANTAVGEASLREQIEATKDVIEAQRQSLAVLRNQSQLGQIQGLDVVAQETALAQTELTLPPLYKSLGQTRHMLSALTGNFPSVAPRETFHLVDLHLPRDLPLTVPSSLIRQRPDVMAAEANLHAASAQVGVAIANRLPNFTLSANYGASSVAWDQLLLPGNRFFGVAGNVAQTIFDGDTLRQRQKAAEAAYDAAAATYRSVVLTAFQNVADALKALESIRAHSPLPSVPSVRLMNTSTSLRRSLSLALLAAFRSSVLNKPTSKPASRSFNRRRPASLIRLLCSNHLAAAGGNGKNLPSKWRQRF